MKLKIFSLIMAIVLIASMMSMPTPAQAAGYGTQFVTSVTYQNISTQAAVISVNFYNEGSATPITITLPNLPANAGSSFYVGSLSQVGSGFRGSAVMSSTQPLVATLVQVPPSTSAVKSRPLSNAFSSGMPSVLIPTVLKNQFSYTSVVAIQNVDSVGNDLTVEFIPVSGTKFTTTVSNLPPGAAKYYDMGTFTHGNLGASFNGSMRVTAKKTGTSTNGAIIASSIEAGTNVNKAYSFEGATQSANTVYMPSAFCRYTNATYRSTYAVQNTGTSAINVTVNYSNGKSETFNNVAGGAKVSIPGCGTSDNLNPSNFIGSATITATGPIVGMAKISTNTGLITAFLGFTNGASKIALPYVRWTESQWTPGGRARAVLAIQNIGGSNLAAGSVTVKYYDKNGALVGTQAMGAIAPGGKANSNPKDAGAGNEFGYYSDGTFGGSAIVQGPSGSNLAVVVRISTNTGGGTIDGEDYNGFPLQ